jgi:hypothetical protein
LDSGGKATSGIRIRLRTDVAPLFTMASPAKTAAGFFHELVERI